MKISEVQEIVGKTPHTTAKRGIELYNFILETKPERCLELGFAHGVATIWIAAALQELGRGKIVSVDNHDALSRQPSAIQMIERAGLQEFTELHYDEYSYTWHLKRNLNSYRTDGFDFAFIDGAHSWDVDALAFYLVAEVLNQGAWVLFDDLDWSYSSSQSLRNTEFVKLMSKERQDDQQVRSIWELIVQNDRRFGSFLEDNGWGWAQKTESSRSGPVELQIVSRRPAQSIKRALKALIR